MKVAFRAAYSNLTFIRSRKVAAISLELPIEQADAFIAAFGSPNPAEEKWVAIARLVEPQDKPPPEEAQPEPEHTNWHNLRPSAQAAIRCEDPLFWQFMMVNTQEKVIAAVREACGVKSRSELDRRKDAQMLWEHIDGQFIEWKRRRKL